MAAGAGSAVAIASDASQASSFSNYYALAVVLVIDTLEWLGLIPDPIKVLEGYLIGRPRAAATIDTIDFLQHHRNPVGRLWGIQLSRMFTDDNIVISDSDPGAQKMLGLARSQFIKGAMLQGLTNTRAQEIAQLLMTPAAQEQPIKIDFLTQAAPDGFVFQGAGDIASMYSEYLQAHLITGGGPGTLSPEQKAEQYVYKHAKISDLNNSWIGPQLPDSYTPTGPITAGQNPCGSSYSYDPTANVCWLTRKLPTNMITQSCDAGYQYNPASFLCEWIPTGQQTGGNGNGNGNGNGGGTNPINPNSPIPPPPPPVANGDELTDCCNSTAVYLYFIATAIETLSQNAFLNNARSGSGDTQKCCQQLSAQIGGVAAAIENLPSALGLGSGAGPAPVDLSLIVAALATLDADLKEGNANTYAGAAEISSSVANVANAIASATPVDLTPIVDQLKAIVSEGDVSEAAFQFLRDTGFMTPDESQFYAGMPWADAIFTLLKRIGYDLLIGSARLIGYDLTTGTWSIPNPAAWAGGLLADVFKISVASDDVIIAPIIAPFVEAVIQLLTPGAAPAYGQYGIDPDGPINASLSLALTAAIAAWGLGYVGIDEGEPLTKIAELIGGAGGLESLRDVQIGPLVREGIAKVATMKAKALYRQDGPPFDRLAHLAARGYITPARAADLAPLSGLPAEFVDPIQRAAYTSIGERTLIRLMETNLFSPADLAAVMTEHGMNAADQHRQILAAPFLATVSQRNQLQSAVEKQFVEGFTDLPTLTNELESLQQNSDYLNLIQTRCQIEQTMAIAKELANSYTILALTGTVDLQLYATQLEGVGYQPIAVNAMVAVVESKLTATNLRQAAAAERALERATVSIERRAALKNYANGTTDAAGLTASLLLTGLTSTQAAAWVDLAVLRKQGSPRLTYGLLKSPADAQLLRQRVTSLGDQRKKQLITDLAYIQALQALGLPQTWINALRAAADAESTPSSANKLIPITTG